MTTIRPAPARPDAPAPAMLTAGLALAAALLAVGCATPTAAPEGAAAPKVAAPAPEAGVRPAAPAASGAAAARPADPTAPKPFAEVVRGAVRQDGFIPLWRKDEKVWLEIAPQRLNQPLLFSTNISSSVGERGLYASQMGPQWMVEFRRVGNQMQVVARQLAFRGDRDPASRLAVADSFSDSLVGASPVASAEHPERKSVLVDAAFLLGDVAGYSTALEQAFRLPFAVDKANSYFDSVRAEAALTTLSAKLHYAVPRLPAPPLLPPGAPAPQTPPPPSFAPDARSLFVGFVYSFAELPEKPMPVRLADPRVGYFVEGYTDLSDDLKPTSRVYPIRRWRLEKKDPQAALSEPVKPLTYWLDRNIPARYRASVEAGVLEWNKAFEKIGFKNALVVLQQPDDADFNTMDAGHTAIRWFVGADVGFAIGPSRGDPRTGELLTAHIGMSDVFGRGARRLIREDLLADPGSALSTKTPAVAPGAADLDCRYATEAALELGFAMDLLEARGDLEPDSPQAEAFVQAYVKDTITHEVGHTLGLRHNFKASTTVSREQLKDVAFVRERGLSGSVMDYNPFNLGLKGEGPREPNMTGLGRYDYWAIEYGYKPLSTEGETAERLAIAARSASDPSLAFADDGDAGGFPGNDGLDPLVNRFDLGDDPLAYAQRRFALSKELWERMQQRGAIAGDDPERLRRSLLAAVGQAARMPEIVAKYVGGLHTTRDLPGSGRPNYRPVDSDQQRQALRLLADEIFSSTNFRLRPEFLAQLGADSIDARGAPRPWSIQQVTLALQVPALDKLLDAGTARRLLDLQTFLPEPQRKGAISLDEVYSTVQGAIWSELKSGQDIDPVRRNLQREHLKRLQGLLTRPSPALPADAISLARLRAVELQAQLRSAVTRKGLAVETRAHLEDALALISEALKATLQRS